MRTAALALLLLTACAPAASKLPVPLRRLILADDSGEITPVHFPHGEHAARTECATCHHPTPDPIPAPCVTCHPMEPEEGRPPDL